ncbi:MAG: hypothetical protein ACO20H_04480 [Bacteriovoracaceae bacterium]
MKLFKPIFIFVFCIITFPSFAKECSRKSDKAFRDALNKCIKEGFYQVEFSDECPSRTSNYSCFSRYEQEIATLPKQISIRTKTQTFNPFWYFALQNNNIWVKRKDKTSSWQLLKPHKKNYRPTEISSDDRNLISLDPNNKVYTMFGGLSDTVNKFWWRQTWGLPFWFGGTWKIPSWVKSWDISFFSPDYDKYHSDSEGNLHDVGIGVTHIWMLDQSGQRVIFNDPWLPHDTSYETCSPLRGRFKSHALSANGSKIFVINKYGDMYTKSYDFDMAGYNAVAFDYTYKPVGPIITNPEDVSKENRNFLPRKLPIPDWKKQPKINGTITDRISVHKIGAGGENRILRVEGKNAKNQTGFWEKNANSNTQWKFTVTNFPLEGNILDNSPVSTSHLTLGDDESIVYKGEQKGIKISLINFHPYCTPSTLRVSDSKGRSIDLLFHHRAQIRVGKSIRGITKKPKGFKGAIEIPKNTILNQEFLRVIPKEIIDQGIIDVEGSYSSKKIKIKAKKKLKWTLSMLI